MDDRTDGIHEAGEPVADVGDDLAALREVIGARLARPAHDASADPEGDELAGRARTEMEHFRRDLEAFDVQHVHGNVFQRFSDASRLTVAGLHWLDRAAPQPRPRLHVYGPDRDDVRDADRYYRYAWRDHHVWGRVSSTEQEIVRQGRLSVWANAYSEQSSYALAGAGLFFRPARDTMLSIRPYVQWTSYASFTGTERTPASAVAQLGIFVQSRAAGGGLHHVDRDHAVTVYAQTTQGYSVGDSAGGAATVGDGLATEVLAVRQRRYSIFVYALVETSAAPRRARNETRYVMLELDATVPFVVLEETSP